MTRRLHSLQIIGEIAHRGQVFYINEILGSLAVETMKRPPLPNLHSLIQDYCGLYLDSGDDMPRICFKQLLDGVKEYQVEKHGGWRAWKMSAESSLALAKSAEDANLLLRHPCHNQIVCSSSRGTFQHYR